jgi:DUF1680 family protein
MFTALLIVMSALQAAPEAAGKAVLEPFEFGEVSLGDGMLRREQDEIGEYYLRVPNDDLLKGFRTRAGRDAPGVDPGGWYSKDIFCVFGQIVSGLARLAAATGDPACRDKVNALVDGWAECVEPDGYFFLSRGANSPHYVYDKIVGGLTDVYLYCGHADAPQHLAKITGWAEKNLDRSRPYDANGGYDPTEWYTLSENLYRAYVATDDRRYRDFAEVWEFSNYWDIYARGDDIFGPHWNGKPVNAYHAYSHVNTLGGAGMAYAVKGEERYLRTLVNAHDYLTANQCYATGGYGPNEQFLPADRLLAALPETHNTFETQCGTWAAFKLCKYLMQFTGDARYGDWMERLALNGIGASIPMTGDGRVFYYSDYNPHGGEKRNHPEGWTCCTGTRPMAAAEFNRLAFFHDRDSLCVNLYLPSSVHWAREAGPVTATQATRFPEDKNSTLVLSMEKPQRFALKLRAPEWLSSPMIVSVNGARVDAAPDARHWVVLDREWRDGDRVEVRLSMYFHYAPLRKEAVWPFALCFGPVTLAFRGIGRSEMETLAAGEPGALLERVPGEALAWRMKSATHATARPFHTYREGEPYTLYLDPTLPRRLALGDMTFTGAWNKNGAFKFTRETGATAEVAFEGTAVRLIAQRFDDAGRAELRLDGEVVDTLDLYGPGRGLPFEWRRTGLAPGKHSLRMTVTGEETAASTDHYINIVGLDVNE